MLKVRKLTFGYEDNTDIIKDIDFDMEKGDYICLIGANGSGKSTLAKLISGLLSAKSGEIVIDGLVLNLDNLTSIREKIGIVFQNPDNQFIGSTVEDDIAFGLENYQVESEKMPDIIKHYAAEVKMTDFLKFEPSSLSGGQKQRVAIAGVLATNPELLIFDEATSMLDPIGKKEIINLIKSLNKEKHKSVISITHDMEEISDCDKVLVLDEGRIAFYGKPHDLIKNSEVVKKAKLNLPFATEFALLLKNKGKNIRIPLSLKELEEEIWQLNLKK